MLEKIKILFTSSRPISWVNTAYPFALGYLLSGGALDAVFFIGTLFFLVPYNLLMYGVNDVFDYESDMKNPRKGGVEGAIVPKKLHAHILRWSFLLPIPFIVVLAFLGTQITTTVLLGVLFFVVAYSLKGLRFKEIPFLDSITSSLHFVGPLLYALSFFGFPAEAWPYVLAFLAWGIASQAFGAIQDIEPDRKAGIRSVATVVGARSTLILTLAFYLLSAGIVFTQGSYMSLLGVCVLFYVANIMPYVGINDKRAAETRAGWRRFLWINYVSGFFVTLYAILWAIL